MSAASPAPEELSHRRVLSIAIPIVLSNATIPILGAVDTGVVGQMGQAAPIGAVGVGAIILTTVYWMFGFLRMGTTGLAAQAQGAGDHHEVSALLTRVIMIGLCAGAVFILLQHWVMALGLHWSKSTPEVEGLAQSYMRIRIWSAPAAIAIYGITGWLVALERTRSVLVMQLWMNGLNILLDLWFVLGLDWGVSGVAFASFLSEWSGLLLGLWLCRSAFSDAGWRDWARVFDRIKLRRMALVNTDILIRSLFLQAIFTSFMLLGTRFDEATLAANQVLLQFLSIVAFALDGFAFSAEALVGKALARRAPMELRRAALLTGGWGLALNLVLSIVFALAGGAIIDLMADAPEVREVARVYLPYMVAAPFVGLAAWMLDGIFIGATSSADMRNMMGVTFVIYCLSVALLMPMMGNHGLWLSLLISFVARAVTLGSRYPALEASAAG